MAKHNIKDLIKEWAAIQSERAEKTKQNNVRVKCGRQNYYAQVQLNNKVVMICPIDAHIPITTFDENRLHGCSEHGQNGLVLRPRFGDPVYLSFRTEKQRNQALARVQVLIGDETTTENSSSDSGNIQ